MSLLVHKLQKGRMEVKLSGKPRKKDEEELRTNFSMH